MKDYKRLTKSDWYNTKFDVAVNKEPRVVLHRLWELENRIESGEFDYVADSETGQTITDLLIEFDEMGFAPTTVCPDGEKYAVDWRERVRKEFARLAAENKRLKEEAAEQKSIADHEHATQMEWFSIAGDYKAEAAAMQKRLDNAVELPCKVGDKVYWVEDDPNIPGICEFTVQGFSFRTNNNDGLRVIIGTFLEPCVDYYKNKQLFFDRSEAEARLAELKGG